MASGSDVGQMTRRFHFADDPVRVDPLFSVLMCVRLCCANMLTGLLCQ